MNDINILDLARQMSESQNSVQTPNGGTQTNQNVIPETVLNPQSRKLFNNILQAKALFGAYDDAYKETEKAVNDLNLLKENPTLRQKFLESKGIDETQFDKYWNDASNAIFNQSEKLRKNLAPTVDADFSWDYITSPGGLTRTLGEAFGSTLALAPAMALTPESLVAGGVGLLGRAGLNKMLTTLVAKGGSVRRENLANGMSEEEARANSIKTALLNVPLLMATNTAEGLLLGAPIFRAAKSPIRTAGQIAGRTALESGQNSLEETAQEIISNVNTGKKWNENIERAAKEGFFGGLGLGAIGATGQTLRPQPQEIEDWMRGNENSNTPLTYGEAMRGYSKVFADNYQAQREKYLREHPEENKTFTNLLANNQKQISATRRLRQNTQNLMNAAAFRQQMLNALARQNLLERHVPKTTTSEDVFEISQTQQPTTQQENIFGVENYNMPTQSDRITQQVSQLKNGWQQIIPQIGGALKNKFGINATISSAARTAEHNANVGGVPTSHHIIRENGGDALDIVFDRDTSQAEQDEIANYFKNSGLFKEVLYHDVGSGAHLHLGGLQSRNQLQK